jgi:hypothetical protein
MGSCVPEDCGSPARRAACRLIRACRSSRRPAGLAELWSGEPRAGRTSRRLVGQADDWSDKPTTGRVSRG